MTRINHQDFATTGFDMRNIVGNMLEIDINASSDKPCNNTGTIVTLLVVVVTGSARGEMGLGVEALEPGPWAETW